jgi:hypothetical protein
MLNFYNPIRLFCIVLCGLYASTLITQSTHLYVNSLDVFYRLWLNDFILNSYYFYWTSFWYLLITISLLKLLLAGLYIRIVKISYVFVMILLFTYSLTLGDYWSYVFSPTTNLLWESQINSLLTNSINKYHPLIFYISLIWIYVSYVLLTTNINNISFSTTFTKTLISQKISTYFIMITFTLSLGSWWALQEGSWGGWWNWDASEVFGLLVMLVYIQILHKVFTKSPKSGLKVTVLYSLIFLLLTYVLIQLNFDLVSHNFGTKITQFISSDQFYYIIAGLLFITTFIHLLELRQKVVAYYLVNKIKPVLVKVSLLVFVTLLAVIFSFSELLNNFYWLLFESNTMNVINLTTYYAPIALITIYILILRVNVLNFHSYVCLIIYGEYFLVFMLSLFKKSPTTLIHILVYLFVFISHQCLNQSLMHWGYSNTNEYSFLNNLLIDNYLLNIKPNTSYLEFSFTTLTNNQVTDIGWSFIHKTTNLQTHAFQHNLNTCVTLQGLLSSFLEYVHNILVLDYSSQTLSLLVPLILYSIISLSQRHKLIMF